MSEPCPPENARPVKLAHLCQLDGRTKVGSAAFFANHTENEARLAAWRELHKVAGDHETVHELGEELGYDSSIDMTTGEMIELIENIQQGEKDEERLRRRR